MAIAERELASEQAEDENTNGTPDENPSTTTDGDTEKAKRERVDLDSLPAHEKVQLSIAVPAGLKLALTKMAESQEANFASFVRDHMASIAGYTIPDEFNQKVRAGKYAGMSDEDVKAAKAAEGKAQRDRVKALLTALKSNPDALAEIAAQAGVNVSDL